jgi:radical SAM protein with 4Fe4S-binding SPASM domain
MTNISHMETACSFLSLKKLSEIDNVLMPLHLTIGTTNRCNLRCWMCFRQNAELKPSDLTDMDSKLFEKIADQCFPYVKTVTFTVSGEPLLSNNLLETLELVQKYRIKLEITSNATLMNNDEIIKKLIRTLSALTISFDGATRETYESIRIGAKYDNVLYNITRFNSYRNELADVQRPKLGFSFVLMRSNIEEFPAFIKLAHKFQADFISSSHVVITEPKLKDESLIFHKELANEKLEEAKEVASNLGVNLSMPPLYSLEKENVGDKNVSDKLERLGIIKCPYLWSHSWIEKNGDVVPCCIASNDRPLMGNMLNSSFSEIWNGEIYKNMRKGILTGQPFDVCKHCYLAEREM